MALGQNLWLMQIGLACVGLYGLTVLAILICAAPATLGTGEGTAPRARPTLVRPRSPRWRWPAFGALRLPAGADADRSRASSCASCSRTCRRTPSSARRTGPRSCAATSRSATARPRPRPDGHRRRRPIWSGRNPPSRSCSTASRGAGPDRRRRCRPARTLVTGAARSEARRCRARAAALLQLDPGRRGRRRHPRDLRQGASRAVRRIRAARSSTRACGRSASASSCRSRAASRRATARPRSDVPGPAAGRRQRSATRRSSRARRCRRRAPARPDPERHQRWLVRRHARAPPAFRAGPPARRRAGPAAGAGRQYRHLGGRRSLRPDLGASRSAGGRARRRPCPPHPRSGLSTSRAGGLLDLRGRCSYLCLPRGRPLGPGIASS